LTARARAASVRAMPMARFSQVAKTYANGVQALEGFSLDVVEGEFLTLIGPSGCGKSTALRLLAGLDAPSAGEVAWRGAPPEIGYVFQDPTLMPWASAFANVWLPLRLKGVSRAAARERVEAALDLVGLRDFAAAKPRELSGGMRMRVSIARALVTGPQMLLMDEPFAALDEITRFRLNDELLALKARLGCTLVFVTHSVFEAVYLSSRVVVMTGRPGRVAASIPVEEKLPRSEAFRTSVRYAETAREVSAALRAHALDKHPSRVHA
jgi:NitT/TauT family transport system ATP-binding protein